MTRRALSCIAAAVLAVAPFTVPTAADASRAGPGDGPTPVVVGSSPEYHGVDLQVRPAGLNSFEGWEVNDPGAFINQWIGKAGGRTWALFRVCGHNQAVGKLTVKGSGNGRNFHVAYRRPGGANITAAVTSGQYRTRYLGTNQCARFRMIVERTHAAHKGDKHRFTVTTTGGKGWNMTDVQSDVVIAKPRPEVVIGNDTVSVP